MKQYTLILTGMFLLLVLATTVALASVSIPPTNPTANPPGPSMSYEQVLKVQSCQEWYDNYIRTQCFTVPGGAGPTIDPACRRRALQALQECFEAVLNPPTLILPNGGSPGQGK